MELSTSSYKRVDLMKIDGRVDSSNATQLDLAFDAIFDEKRNNIVVDLSGLTFLSSAGLRAVVSALKTAKKKGGDIFLSEPTERIQEVLKLAGMHHLFNIYDTTLEAVASF